MFPRWLSLHLQLRHRRTHVNGRLVGGGDDLKADTQLEVRRANRHGQAFSRNPLEGCTDLCQWTVDLERFLGGPAAEAVGDAVAELRSGLRPGGCTATGQQDRA